MLPEGIAAHIFGVRHHGPGSARSLRRAMEALEPEAVLVEGPPEADSLVALAANPGMRPPVALLAYALDDPRRAAFFPFADFSPEWVAIQYALARHLPLHFIDLPMSHQLGLASAEAPSEPTEPPPEAADAPPEPPQLHLDPLGALARAAGYRDGERWWERMVEQRQEGADLFTAILEAMAALRQASPPSGDPLEALREAAMRQAIRLALEAGGGPVAVVCGAWHAPALTQLPPASDDQALLENLPQLEVAVTWTPWTYGRLSRFSGYGAGVDSPGWYHHLWSAPDRLAIRWMTRIAHLLRREGVEASTAQVIDAVRLADSLAALRDLSLPGLPELNEATRATLCFGSDLPMRLIHQKLIVGERLGAVPDETPMAPLQQDLRRAQKRLRLPADAAPRQLDLDQRKPMHLGRSHLLHRLALLGIPWGEPLRSHGGRGSFHEVWRLQWQPEFDVRLIEASMWGNTVETAATAFAVHAAQEASDLPALVALVNQTLLADLPQAIEQLMSRLQAETALSGDVPGLMEALPPLAHILRYGNVRQTDAQMVGGVVDGLVARLCIGLPGACASLDDDAARAMRDRLQPVHQAVGILQNEAHVDAWHRTLGQLADQRGLHGLIAGCSCRLLLDDRQLDPQQVARRMRLALTTAVEPSQAAAWVEGFLGGSGLILLHDEALLGILDHWVTNLSGQSFQALFPLLRRTFALFPPAERRQIGERLSRVGALAAPGAEAGPQLDLERAQAVLPMVARLLGLPLPGGPEEDGP